jgi:hypothetical protein
MKIRIFISSILILCLVHQGIGQKKKQKSWKNTQIANAYFEVHKYANAAKYYERVYFMHNSSETALKLGQCYQYMRKYEQSKKWFHISYITNIYRSDKYSRNLAKSMILMGEYTEAKKILLDHHKTSLLSSKDSVLLASCDSALVWMETPVAKIVNFSEINTSYSDASTSFFGNDIVFSSNREGALRKNHDGMTDAAYYNLFYVTKKPGKWSKPKDFSSSLNSIRHEGGAVFSEDGSEVYMTRATSKAYNEKDTLKESHLKLYKSVRKGFSWSSPEYFMQNNNPYSYGHPAIGHHDKIFIFVSDMPGGFGGTDLYITLKVGKKWSKPQNMGKTVNSPLDEIFPFISNNGTLFYSSNGKTGLGGFDLFQTELKDGIWVEPINLGYPINSCADDFSYVENQELDLKLITSNRVGGKGEEDIYKVIYLE